MRKVIGFLAILVAASAVGQTETPRHLTPTARPGLQKGDKRPVTSAEALAVFKENRRVLAAAIGQSVPGQIKIEDSSKPVTREQIVVEFDQEYEAMRPQLKFTPNPVEVDASYIHISPKVRPQLIKLIRLGFVGRAAPLVTGPQDSIGVSELGDAVGFFLSRLAQLTHMPSPKWTPMLGAGG